jgi:hypothetical protein
VARQGPRDPEPRLTNVAPGATSVSRVPDRGAFARESLRGGWLSTNDGDDYYVLQIDVGDAIITVGD